MTGEETKIAVAAAAAAAVGIAPGAPPEVLTGAQFPLAVLVEVVVESPDLIHCWNRGMAHRQTWRPTYPVG